MGRSTLSYLSRTISGDRREGFALHGFAQWLRYKRDFQDSLVITLRNSSDVQKSTPVYIFGRFTPKTLFLHFIGPAMGCIQSNGRALRVYWIWLMKKKTHVERILSKKECIKEKQIFLSLLERSRREIVNLILKVTK